MEADVTSPSNLSTLLTLAFAILQCFQALSISIPMSSYIGTLKPRYETGCEMSPPWRGWFAQRIIVALHYLPGTQPADILAQKAWAMQMFTYEDARKQRHHS